MPLYESLESHKKVVLLGSGGLNIGQAGEFDYSGTQAIKALLEEGFEVIVVNPNIATVQTDPVPGVKVYLYPIEPRWVEKIIEIEKPAGIIAGFGGQTALSCLLGLDAAGVLTKFKVQNLGSTAATLKATEDRDSFARQMDKIGIPIPTSGAAHSVTEALEIGKRIGYPVIARLAFSLGGLGSGFAKDEAELTLLCNKAFNNSDQVLIEKSLQGWKEVEYEVMRDRYANKIAICNMENFDPMGIHTGDSIVVAPSQTLTDREFQLLRNAAFKIVESFQILGECNVQFAMSPDSEDFYVIEVNARLSRSSALASKASGYPIAYIAAKVVCGYDLMELKNPVTGITYAFYEPAMDYIAIKVPKWDLDKFQGASRVLDSKMKSVGEVMAIGRSLPEAFQKAIRMVTESPYGLSLHHHTTNPSAAADPQEQMLQTLDFATDTRIFDLMTALRLNISIQTIHDLTRIDLWFLQSLEHIFKLEQHISQIKTIAEITPKDLRQWKQNGFGDEQIVFLLDSSQNSTEAITPKKTSDIPTLSLQLRQRRETLGIKPWVKKIDTTAAEYPSPSNYLYFTYGGDSHDPIEEDRCAKRALVLGAGPYRIGTSVEFDWCAVTCSKVLRKAGWRSTIINCNPETVSTDYNSSDRLYFEEITLERIMDVFEFEGADGIVACFGGQHSNNLIKALTGAHLPILGHSLKSVEGAENRELFSQTLDQLGIDQPRWISASLQEEITDFINEVNFPLLIRPSFVISGAAMKIAYNEKDLLKFLDTAETVSKEYPVVISEFFTDHRELEFDGVARKGEIIAAIASEHIENAGVHSGDATVVVPAQSLYVETIRKARKAAKAIVAKLELNGPFNIQFICRNNEIKVIELNARASRSFPFVSKVCSVNLAKLSTLAIIGEATQQQTLFEDALDQVGVKSPMFSFARLGEVESITNVEMTSTGEVGCIAEEFDQALLLALESSGIPIPKKGILVSSGREKEKLEFLKGMQVIKDMQLPVYASVGTAKYLAEHGYKCTALPWPGEGTPDCCDAISKGWVDLVINVPKNYSRAEMEIGAKIRITALNKSCPLITNMEKAICFLEALDRKDHQINHQPIPLSCNKHYLAD